MGVSPPKTDFEVFQAFQNELRSGFKTKQYPSMNATQFLYRFGMRFESIVLQHVLKLNEHLDANLTSAVNCRMAENERQPMRFCCFQGASISVLEKTTVGKEAKTKVHRFPSSADAPSVWTQCGSFRTNTQPTRRWISFLGQDPYKCIFHAVTHGVTQPRTHPPNS